MKRNLISLNQTGTLSRKRPPKHLRQKEEDATSGNTTIPSKVPDLEALTAKELIRLLKNTREAYRFLVQKEPDQVTQETAEAIRIHASTIASIREKLKEKGYSKAEIRTHEKNQALK